MVYKYRGDWRHTLSITDKEKKIVDSVIEKYAKENIKVSFNNSIRYILKWYKKQRLDGGK